MERASLETLVQALKTRQSCCCSSTVAHLQRLEIFVHVDLNVAHHMSRIDLEPWSATKGRMLPEIQREAFAESVGQQPHAVDEWVRSAGALK